MSTGTYPLHRLTHPQPRHHHPQPPPTQPTRPNLPLHLTQLRPLTQNPHIVQFLQHQFLMFQPHRICGLEVGQGVRE